MLPFSAHYVVVFEVKAWFNDLAPDGADTEPERRLLSALRNDPGALTEWLQHEAVGKVVFSHDVAEAIEIEEETFLLPAVRRLPADARAYFERMFRITELLDWFDAFWSTASAEVTGIRAEVRPPLDGDDPTAVRRFRLTIDVDATLEPIDVSRALDRWSEAHEAGSAAGEVSFDEFVRYQRLLLNELAADESLRDLWLKRAVCNTVGDSGAESFLRADSEEALLAPVLATLPPDDRLFYDATIAQDLLYENAPVLFESRDSRIESVAVAAVGV